MEYTIDALMRMAKTILAPEHYRRLVEDRVEHHAPLWHVYGVLGHMNAVLQAATRLEQMCGVSVMAEAWWHDAYKFHQFARALKLFDAGQDPTPAYNGHEIMSASLAGNDPNIDPAGEYAIMFHNLTYLPTRADEILGNLKTITAVRRWMLLCSADAVGWGWTENQKAQRPKVSDRLTEVARTAGVPVRDRLTYICQEAVLFWDPSPVPVFA